LQKGISLSGENQDFFVQGRIACLARRLQERGIRPKAALDFGCGTGRTVPVLLEQLGSDLAVGVDVSEKSLELARASYGSGKVLFEPIGSNPHRVDMDVVHCNGVFHHIPLPDQSAAMRYVYDSLRPGGFFAFFENNPWNFGARMVMKRIPFDRDAVMISPRRARQLLRAVGFEIVVTDYLFFFPHFLRILRQAERYLIGMPLGAQYLVFCRKPPAE